MSKVKTPREKKRLSLERDRRNRYGENNKSSRKNIARGKQRAHQDERRVTKQTLRRITHMDANNADDAESVAKSKGLLARRRGFKKWPDQPLGTVLETKRQRGGKYWITTSVTRPRS